MIEGFLNNINVTFYIVKLKYGWQHDAICGDNLSGLRYLELSCCHPLSPGGVQLGGSSHFLFVKDLRSTSLQVEAPPWSKSLLLSFVRLCILRSAPSQHELQVNIFSNCQCALQLSASPVQNWPNAIYKKTTAMYGICYTF